MHDSVQSFAYNCSISSIIIEYIYSVKYLQFTTSFLKLSPQYRPTKYKTINLGLCAVSKSQFSSLFFAIRDTLKIDLFSPRYSSERNTRSTSIA